MYEQRLAMVMSRSRRWHEGELVGPARVQYATLSFSLGSSLPDAPMKHRQVGRYISVRALVHCKLNHEIVTHLLNT